MYASGSGERVGIKGDPVLNQMYTSGPGVNESRSRVVDSSAERMYAGGSGERECGVGQPAGLNLSRGDTATQVLILLLLTAPGRCKGSSLRLNSAEHV